jgi:predicted esterase
MKRGAFLRARSKRGFTPIEILIVIVALAVPAALIGLNVLRHVDSTKDAAARSQEGQAQGEAAGVIGVRNAAGRSGAYYLPSGPRAQSVPLLVLLHGSGGSGEGLIPVFRPLAQARRFAIIAPDSRRSPAGQFAWQVGDRPGDVTPDLTHVMSCIEWVRAHTGLVVDGAHVLIAGYSAGGSSAPYIASNRPPFTHLAVLHGGVFPGGIGPRRMPAWFSTGEQDRYRPVALVRQAADALAGVGFTTVTFRAYPGDHGLSDAEVRGVIAWWLGQ